MSRPERPWSVPIAVSDLSEAGLKIELEADARTRMAVAKAAGVDDVMRLDASFDLALNAREEVHVVGTVSATVKQSCVVTLEPVVNEVVEAIDLVFALRPGTAGTHGIGVDGGECAELPEPLVGGMVDLGAVATEFLVLGVDPYPRKPGAVFEAPRDVNDGGGPFAQLAALKPEPRG